MSDPIDIQDGACEKKKKKSDGGPAYPLPAGHATVRGHHAGYGPFFQTVEVCTTGPSIRTLAAMHFMAEMMGGQVSSDGHPDHRTINMGAPLPAIAKLAFDAAQAFVDEMEKRNA